MLLLTNNSVLKQKCLTKFSCIHTLQIRWQTQPWASSSHKHKHGYLPQNCRIFSSWAEKPLDIYINCTNYWGSLWHFQKCLYQALTKSTTLCSLSSFYLLFLQPSVQFPILSPLFSGYLLLMFLHIRETWHLSFYVWFKKFYFLKISYYFLFPQKNLKVLIHDAH